MSVKWCIRVGGCVGGCGCGCGVCDYGCDSGCGVLGKVGVSWLVPVIIVMAMR